MDGLSVDKLIFFSAFPTPNESFLYRSPLSFSLSPDLIDIIDDFLLEADKNNDGFLNYNEYRDAIVDISSDDDRDVEHRPTPDQAPSEEEGRRSENEI